MKVSKKLALGITVEGNVRRQVTGSNLSSKAIFNRSSSNPNELFPKIASNEVYYQSNYTHIGLRLKLGASYESAAHHLGLVLSSPLLKLYGTGSVLSDISINNLTLPGTSSDLNLLASTRQTKLKTTWKTPLSIAGGYAYDYGSGQFSLVTEFFSGLKNYTILKADDALFVKNSDVETPEAVDDGGLNLTDERKKVLNFGIGFSKVLNPTIVLMLALRSDFNYLKTSADDIQNIDLWNNYHFQFGANFKRRKFNLRAGLQLSYGRTSNYEQQANFDTLTEDNLLIGQTVPVPANRFGASLLLSYIHNF
jgi:hypothetical protein